MRLTFWHETFLPLGTPHPLLNCTGVGRRLWAFAPRNRDGVRRAAPVSARWRSRCAERGLRQASRVGARPAAGCSKLQSFIRCGRTIPQVWPGMSSTGIEARRAEADGIHSALSGRRGSSEIRFMIRGGRSKADQEVVFGEVHSALWHGIRFQRSEGRNRGLHGSPWTGAGAGYRVPANGGYQRLARCRTLPRKLALAGSSRTEGLHAPSQPIDQNTRDAPNSIPIGETKF